MGWLAGSGLCPTQESELVPGRKSTGGQQGAREAPPSVGWLREDKGRGPGRPGESLPALTEGWEMAARAPWALHIPPSPSPGLGRLSADFTIPLPLGQGPGPQ